MLCAIAIIDPAAREQFVKLSQISENFGLAPRYVYGHITLATYIGSDENRFMASCREILSGYSKFSIWYDKIEVFPSAGTVVAIPQEGNALSTIQKEIARHWAADLNQWTQEDTWKAHTTLVHNPQAELYAIAGAMREALEPFAAQIDRIEFSRVCEEGYEIIGCVELQ